jgi:hypothetical protein
MKGKERTVIQNLRKQTAFSHRLLILVVFSLAVFAVGVPSLEAAACERAFVNCMDELFAETSPFWMIYCATGYAFCLKYID